MIVVKRSISIVLWLFCALMAWTVATAPMLVIAGPAFLMVASGAAAWLLWHTSR